MTDPRIAAAMEKAIQMLGRTLQEEGGEPDWMPREYAEFVLKAFTSA